MNFKLNKKFLSICTSGVMLGNLCGCNEENNVKSSKTESSVDSVCEVDSVMSSVVPLSTTCTFTTCTTPVVTTISVTTSSLDLSPNSQDVAVLDYFNTMGDNLTKSYNLDSFLESGKKYFIYCVDFLFYDSEINGIKFSDLTDMAKQQLLRDISVIDELICSKFPNYKEDIDGLTSDAYDKAALIIKAGSNNIKEFSKEKLGEENYNKIKYYKDIAVSQTVSDFEEFKDILNGGKQFVKDWYEGLK